MCLSLSVRMVVSGEYSWQLKVWNWKPMYKTTTTPFRSYTNNLISHIFVVGNKKTIVEDLFYSSIDLHLWQLEEV